MQTTFHVEKGVEDMFEKKFILAGILMMERALWYSRINQVDFLVPREKSNIPDKIIQITCKIIPSTFSVV